MWDMVNRTHMAIRAQHEPWLVRDQRAPFLPELCVPITTESIYSKWDMFQQFTCFVYFGVSVVLTIFCPMDLWFVLGGHRLYTQSMDPCITKDSSKFWKYQSHSTLSIAEQPSIFFSRAWTSLECSPHYLRVSLCDYLWHCLQSGHGSCPQQHNSLW